MTFSIGLIGWRGMVGSVLLGRLKEERDLEAIGAEVSFFSTSQVGSVGPAGFGAGPLLDAYDLAALAAMDVIITMQGSAYSKQIHPALRERGWRGYWIDAASELRLDPDSTIILQPLNEQLINRRLREGCKTFVGGNCTVSLLLMAFAGLFDSDLVESVTAMTYQAASGAGAQHIKELLDQMAVVVDAYRTASSTDILGVEQRITEALRADSAPTQSFGAPLASSLLPWIDIASGLGQSREEWKAEVEAQRILGRKTPIPMDGLCVRVGVLRCHSQAVSIRLKQSVPLSEILERLKRPWLRIVPNTPEASIRELTPTAVSRSLSIALGRLRKATFDDRVLLGFTVGDQLLWGAAEPLRCMLRQLADFRKAPGHNGLT